uniref:Polyprotein n=1 Tax=Coral plant nepovirus TaxID=3115765 RepID=A0AAT9J7U7_9SECO
MYTMFDPNPACPALLLPGLSFQERLAIMNMRVAEAFKEKTGIILPEIIPAATAVAVLGKTPCQRSLRVKVLLGLVERAIDLASTKPEPQFLWQRRFGRAIYCLSAKMLRYAALVGISVAHQCVALVEPICSYGAKGDLASLSANISHSKVMGGVLASKSAIKSCAAAHVVPDGIVPMVMGTPNLEIQSPVAGELCTPQSDSLKESDSGTQCQVAGELCTHLNVEEHSPWNPCGDSLCCDCHICDNYPYCCPGFYQDGTSWSSSFNEDYDALCEFQHNYAEIYFDFDWDLYCYVEEPFVVPVGTSFSFKGVKFTPFIFNEQMCNCSVLPILEERFCTPWPITTMEYTTFLELDPRGEEETSPFTDVSRQPFFQSRLRRTGFIKIFKPFVPLQRALFTNDSFCHEQWHSSFWTVPARDFITGWAPISKCVHTQHCLACNFIALAECKEIRAQKPIIVKEPPPGIVKGGAQKLLSTVFARHVVHEDVSNTQSWCQRHLYSALAPFSSFQSDLSTGRQEAEMRANLFDRSQNEQSEHGSPTIAQTIANLRKKRKQNKKKNKVLEYGEGRHGDSSTKILEKDVFTYVAHGGWADKAQKWIGNDTAGILTQQTFPTGAEDVHMPANVQNCVYSPLPQFTEKQLRELLDKQEMKSSGITAIDLAIQSHLGEATPMTAFCTIMDGDNGDPNIAALSGSKFDLGRDRCQVITLPLVNVNLNHLHKQVNEDNKTRLYLATLFNDKCGVYDGAPVFQYGTSQLLEHRPDAYTNQSLCKDDWISIEKRNARKGCRILKGFNVEQHIAQDYEQPLLPFSEEAVLACRPRNEVGSSHAFSARGVVKNYEPSRLERSCPVRFLNDGAGINRKSSQFGTIAGGITQHVDNTSDPQISGPRHSMSRFQSDGDNPFVVAVTKTFNVSKDAKEGTLIGTLDFYSLIQEQKKLPHSVWRGIGLLDPNIEIRTIAGANSFIGLTLGVVHDFFNRLQPTTKLGGKLPRVVGNCMPQTLHPLCEGAVGVHRVNVQEYIGHSLYIEHKGIANPQFHVYMYADNAITAADEWRCTVEIAVRIHPGDEVEDCRDRAIFRVPSPPINYISLDLYKGYGSVALGKDPLDVPVGLDFAIPRVYTGTSVCLGLTQALYQILQGTGGELEGTLRRTGTLFTSCVLRLVMWWETTMPTIEETSSIPHLDIDLSKDKGDFRLKIQSPYGEAPNRELKARLHIFPIGGPIAPKDTNSPFDFSIYIRGIKCNSFVPKLLLPDEEYAWCILGGFTKGPHTLDIKNHVYDLAFAKTTCEVRNFANPLASIFATCGYFSGSIKFHLQFTPAKPTTSSSIIVAKVFGTVADYFYLGLFSSNTYLPFSHTVDLDCADYTGFNIPGGSINKQQFLRLKIKEGEDLHSIQISVTLKPGFAFYGRSCALVE